LEFHDLSLDGFASLFRGRRFDITLANMTLHCVSHLAGFMATAADLTSPGGIFIATIPNPDSYLQSRDDVDLTGTDLTRVQTLEITFRIHGHAPHPARVRYFHRPLSNYESSAVAAGLTIVHYEVPEQVGRGKPRDISVFTARHGESRRSKSHEDVGLPDWSATALEGIGGGRTAPFDD
jgi:hypothetical protein